MRLLTHNALQNNEAATKGKGYPLKITSSEVKVEETAIDDQKLAFVKGILPSIEWTALVQAANDMGIPTIPPILTQDLADDVDFLGALYHVLMNVHLIQGVLVCPVTNREFAVINGVPRMVLVEEECEKVRL